MVKLEITKTLEKEIEKLTELEGYNSIGEYITEKLILLVVNEITFTDIESTQKKIKTLQDDLNSKRQDILKELREEGGKD